MKRILSALAIWAVLTLVCGLIAAEAIARLLVYLFLGGFL